MQTIRARPSVPEKTGPKMLLRTLEKALTTGQVFRVGSMVVPTMMTMDLVTQPRIRQFIIKPR